MKVTPHLQCYKCTCFQEYVFVHIVVSLRYYTLSPSLTALQVYLFPEYVFVYVVISLGYYTPVTLIDSATSVHVSRVRLCIACL